MPSPTRPARLNRSLLALIGTLLLFGGIFCLAFGTGLLRQTLPGLDPSAPLLPRDAAVPSWTPYAVIAGGVVLGLLCLRWLLAQTQRRPKTSTWALPTRSGTSGTTTLDSDRAADALAADIEIYEHVKSAAAALVGDHRRPVVHLDVTTDARADLNALRTRVVSHAIPRLRAALDSDGAAVDLVLRLAADSPKSRPLS